MKVSMIGLGKLGTPVAVAMDHMGHDVMGYDLDPARMRKDCWPFQEGGIGGRLFEDCLWASGLRYGTLRETVAHGEIVFVAVQTPHEPRYEGVTRLPPERKGFDYTYLDTALRDVGAVVGRIGEHKAVCVISTVLPGTMRPRLSLLPDNAHFVYNPFFIAMSTVVEDFLHPEFVLLGVWDEWAAAKVRAFYAQTTDAPLFETSVETAEAIKVLYNTYITAKIVLANTAMEICEKTGADVDAVSDAWALATRRIVSPSYTRGGMGDGGGCHPRDNIALSWLARELGLSYDLFGSLITAREKQAEWLCKLLCESKLPKFILGTAFKAGVNIETGSAALLCKNILEEWGHDVETWDPYIDGGECPLREPHAVLVGTNHPGFKGFEFPEGCHVVDPWGITGKGIGRV